MHFIRPTLLALGVMATLISCAGSRFQTSSSGSSDEATGSRENQGTAIGNNSGGVYSTAGQHYNTNHTVGAGFGSSRLTSENGHYESK